MHKIPRPAHKATCDHLQGNTQVTGLHIKISVQQLHKRLGYEAAHDPREHKRAATTSPTQVATRQGSVLARNYTDTRYAHTWYEIFHDMLESTQQLRIIEANTGAQDHTETRKDPRHAGNCDILVCNNISIRYCTTKNKLVSFSVWSTHRTNTRLNRCLLVKQKADKQQSTSTAHDFKS